MNYSKSGLKLTEQFEQCRLVAYQDQGGVWTIGWGHTFGVHAGMVCTQLEADRWLVDDMRVAEANVIMMVVAPLTQDEFDALVDFVFNLGGNRFEHSTLRELLNAGKYHAAAAEFDKWDHVAGKVCQGLLRRREAERQEFERPDATQLS